MVKRGLSEDVAGDEELRGRRRAKAAEERHRSRIILVRCSDLRDFAMIVL